PFQVGVFASRATFMSGNAAIRACQDLKEKLKKYTARLLEVESDELAVGNYGVFVKADPDKRMSMAEIGAAANYPSATADVFLCGIGTYHPGGPQTVDPKTGEMPLLAAAAFATGIVEVEVDTETGVVEVTKAVHVYDVGKAINPLMCQCQINGGSAMGIGMSLSEDAHPYWPEVDFAVETLGDYVMATAADMPADNQHAIVEVEHPDGPFGAKGFCEMSANIQIPAVAAAIHDAIGVWLTQFPMTPEAVLKALESHQSQG
ncbi:MAG: xanthine dehydrogenase family protein molybdopterin-binding subunit, partial [Deltaproteobacteria bacterium]|nr:xanthine dehydrogenase family protein molybdopterin-binding subunit [Deltaproteobacteria bacterium]